MGGKLDAGSTMGTSLQPEENVWMRLVSVCNPRLSRTSSEPRRVFWGFDCLVLVQTPVFGEVGELCSQLSGSG